MLTIVTTETPFTINILYFFRKFNIQFKTLNSLIEEKLEGNYIFFDKDLYPIINFEKKLENITDKFCYLSKCKSIYYVNAENINININYIDINKLNIYNILFESKNINEIDHIVPPKNITIEYINLLKLKDKNYDNFITNKISYNSYNLYLSNYNHINYNIILFIEKIDDIYNIVLPKYDHCRITLFHNIKIKEDIDLLTAFCKKNNINFYIYICNNWTWFFNINNKRLLWFEKIILTNLKNLNLDLNLLNKYHKIKKTVILDNIISIDASEFVCLPFFYASIDLSIDIKPINIFNIIKTYIYDDSYNKNIIYYNKKYKTSNRFIQNQLLLVRNYPDIINNINEEINNNYNASNIFSLLTKKISMLALCKKEEDLLADAIKIIAIINDPEYLSNLVILFNNVKNQKIMMKLYTKMLKLATDDKYNGITLLCFQKLLTMLNSIDEDTIIVILDFINYIKLNNLINKENLKKILITLFYSISRFIEKINIIEKFNLLVNEVFELKDIMSIDKILSINSQDNNICLLHFLIYLSTNFSAYYTTYDEFIKKRIEIKNNLEYLLLKDIPTCNLDTIIAIPVCNFYLAYQGIPSVDIYKLKSKLIRKICPELNYSIDTNFKNDKINICFHANFLTRWHSVFKDRHQIIKKIADTNEFNVYYSTYDNLTEEVKYLYGKAKHIKLTSKLSETKLTLGKLKLDVLVFCEIGMDPITYFIAHMKLAKVQINTWGHSDSCGIDTIDYFFSSKLYELSYNEAQTHYSEKLILQDSLCTCYINPASRYNINLFKNRYSFGFTDDVILYFCAQSLFKFNPIYDNYLIKILESVNNSCIILLDHDSKSDFIKRFNNKNIVSKFHFVKGMAHNEYLNLINICDIILDPYPFGGCNSSLEAFSLNKVVVTQSSDMINGRFTTGFYKKMKMNELICTNKEKYTSLAIKLGTNIKYRHKIENKIKENNNILFNDQESVNEWIKDINAILLSS
jgi:hypothetical protein